MLAGAQILIVITALVGVFYVLYGVVLSYHWVRYSESWMIAAFSVGSYVVAGVWLLGLMIAAILML